MCCVTVRVLDFSRIMLGASEYDISIKVIIESLILTINKSI